MGRSEALDILREVQSGALSPDDALLRLRAEPYEDLGFAKLDHHRELRQGIAEVIYGAGKTPAQISAIASAMQKRGQRTILITRLEAAPAAELAESLEFSYHETARLAIAGEMPRPTGGTVVIATGGTSDMPVAEEAALTAEALGSPVLRMYDVGVAGLHRLLAYIDDIQRAAAIVAIAGMEGALASVVAGLADCPVIGVPTSVGYGASFGGLSALLSMLNSCASGVSVVNIDNGFGAGYLASMIGHMGK